MIKTIISDFSRTLLFPIDKSYLDSLNDLNHARRDPFLSTFEFNQPLLDAFRALVSTYQLILFTSETIQEEPECRTALNGIFTEIISAKKLGFTKTDPAAYAKIINDHHLVASECLFLDDSAANLVAAQSVGLSILQYKNYSSIAKLLNILKASSPRKDFKTIPKK